MDFTQAEGILGYIFKDKKLLKRALTLPSADNNFNNQTLEFFGDAILDFIVSEKIFNENSTEGDLTDRRKNLVSGVALERVTLKLGLDKFLIKSAGDNKNKKAISSVYEAVVAAIYIDGGMCAAKNFVDTTLDYSAKTESDFKSMLNKFLPKIKIEYDKNTRDIGTPQKPEFLTEITIDGKTFSGTATNKKDAQKLAAQRACEYLNIDK